MIRDASITAADVALCSPSKARQWCRGWEGGGGGEGRWGGKETLQQDPVQFDVEGLFNDGGALDSRDLAKETVQPRKSTLFHCGMIGRVMNDPSHHHCTSLFPTISCQLLAAVLKKQEAAATCIRCDNSDY